MGLGAAGVVQTLTAMPTAWWLEPEVTTSILLAVTRPIVPVPVGSWESTVGTNLQRFDALRQGAPPERPIREESGCPAKGRPEVPSEYVRLGADLPWLRRGGGGVTSCVRLPREGTPRGAQRVRSAWSGSSAASGRGGVGSCVAEAGAPAGRGVGPGTGSR